MAGPVISGPAGPVYRNSAKSAFPAIATKTRLHRPATRSILAAMTTERKTRLGLSRLLGWSGIAHELGMSARSLKRAIAKDPEGRLARLIGKDQASGRACAFLAELREYLEECRARPALELEAEVEEGLVDE